MKTSKISKINKINQTNQLTINSSFEVLARAWHNANSRRWSASHTVTVIRRLENHLFKDLGKVAVHKLTSYRLMQVITQIEASGSAHLATRLIQYLNSIFAFIARHCADYGQRENPALALIGGVIPNQTHHHPALTPDKFQNFFKRLERSNFRPQDRLAILLQLNTFVRSSELRFAAWGEFDLQRKVWEIPATRKPRPGIKYSYRGSKMKTPHLVPLSRQVINILTELKSYRSGAKASDLVVHALNDPDNAMNENRMNYLLRKMGYNTRQDVCAHGFRTMACSTLVDSGHFSEDAIERQMSHQERNSVRAAYTHKAKLIHERVQIMQWWSDYLDASKSGYIEPYLFAIEKNQA